MPNGFENFAQNAIALGDTWRQRRQQKQLASAMSQYDSDPDAAIQGVTAVDPVMGYNMRRQQAADTEKAAEDKRSAVTDTLKTVTGLLRPAAEDPSATPDSIGRAYDAVSPLLSQMGMGVPEIAQWRNMVTQNPSILSQLDDKLQVVPPGAAVTRGGKEVYRNAMAPKTLMVRRGDGGTDVITIDPNTGHPMVANGGGTAQPTGKTTPTQGWAFTGAAEGGYAARDANGAPVNHGVNQATYKPLPGFPANVADLTPEQAQQYYEEKYFNPSGAANMPPALGVLHADTYYINPKRAQQFLDESKGDPQKYLQLRAQWQDSLVRNNPQKYGKYAEAWDNRNQALARQIATSNDSGAGVGSDTGGGMTPVYTTPGKPAAPGKSSHILTTSEIQDINSKGGNLNPNMTWMIDHNGDYKMVGPAAQLKTSQDAGKRDEQFQILNNGLDRLKSVATDLMNHDGLERATGEMSYFPSIRGGKAKDFENQLEALKSQVIVNVLQMMRQASPTGSAMGRVTNYEAQQLQQDIGALQLSNSPQQMRANLQKVVNFADSMKQQYSRAYNLDSSGSQGQQGRPTKGGTAVPPQAAIDKLRSNPSPQMRQYFDQVFGNGAASKYVATRKSNIDTIMPIGVKTPYGTRY